YSDAVRELVLEPLGLRQTGFETPDDAVLGTLPGDLVADPSYPLERRPSGGLWSTVGDLVEYGLAHCRGWPQLHQPVGQALRARLVGARRRARPRGLGRRLPVAPSARPQRGSGAHRAHELVAGIHPDPLARRGLAAHATLRSGWISGAVGRGAIRTRKRRSRR